MHPTALLNCKSFVDCYGPFVQPKGRRPKIVEIGSLNVNGSLRDIVPERFDYVGVDFVAGNGVDVVLDDPYALPFEDGSADIVMASSVFEHSAMFWLLFLEIIRVLRPDGLFYLNVPSNGEFHRYPVDCWRFYPDSGIALVAWAARNGFPTMLIESYTSLQHLDHWNDFVAVFLRDRMHIDRFPRRIVESRADVYNAIVHGNSNFEKFNARTEDMMKIYGNT